MSEETVNLEGRKIPKSAMVLVRIGARRVLDKIVERLAGRSDVPDDVFAMLHHLRWTEGGAAPSSMNLSAPAGPPMPTPNGSISPLRIVRGATPTPPPPSPTALDIGVKVGVSFALELLFALGFVGDRAKANEALVLAMNPSLARRVAVAVLRDNDERADPRPGMTPSEREWPALQRLVDEIAADVRGKLEARRAEALAEEQRVDALNREQCEAWEREQRRQMAESRERPWPSTKRGPGSL